jgi:outer membrane protein assembly factor BamD
MQNKFIRVILIALAFSVSACSLLQVETVDETKTWSAAKLYTEAKDELNSGGYDKSIQYFEKLESRYPFGTFAQQAQIEVAYAHYRQGDQALALAAADRFIKLHPNHPNVDYVYYLKGLINFNDKINLFDFVAHQDLSERDPKALRDAFDSFKLLVDRYPNSVYAKDAASRLNYLVNAMAHHEVHVADYYYRRGAYLDRIFKKNFPNSDLPGGRKKSSGPWWKIW